ncbi:MAG: ribosome biogenesis GTPase YlqF [Eubacteriaceae bacterium]|jgi:ribosome biogenesis GTPase A
MKTQEQLIQWYPGHMKKADRQIREKIKLIDVVVEVLDARVPYASRNPEIQDYCRGRQHVIVLNKADLADPEMTAQWERKFLDEGADAVISYTAVDSGQRKRLAQVIRSCNPKDKKELRCLIAGIPNAGKSTIINSLVGKKKTQIGNKPGVTKGQQWLQAPESLALLDTPGILWPKFEDQEAANHLAWIGSIKDTLLEKENIAGDLMNFLIQNYPENLEEQYGITVDPDQPAWMAFDAVAEKRGLLVKGGEYDYRRTSELLLNDFKNGRIGRITIDRPEDHGETA